MIQTLMTVNDINAGEPAMAWIDVISEESANGELAEIYARLAEQRGKVANILKVHSLNPVSMMRHADLYTHLLFGKSGLTRWEREAIAVVVSAVNACAYCVNHHAEALGRYEKNLEQTRKRLESFDFSAFEPRRAALLDYARKLTQSPSTIDESVIINLRENGITDNDILDANLVAAYFNFVNRIALGLGVKFNDDELQGYKT